MRGGGDLDVDDGVGDAVELDRLVARRGGTREEGLARSQVAENDCFVLGVQVGLHDCPLKFVAASKTQPTDDLTRGFVRTTGGLLSILACFIWLNKTFKKEIVEYPTIINPVISLWNRRR